MTLIRATGITMYISSRKHSRINNVYVSSVSEFIHRISVNGEKGLGLGKIRIKGQLLTQVRNINFE